MKNNLRWIFFLPLAFIASIVFPLILLTFVGFIVPKIDMTLWLWKIFNIIKLGASGAIFVGFSYLIVPNHKRLVALITMILYILFVSFTLFFSSTYIESYWEIIIPSTGAIVAYFLVLLDKEGK